MASLKMFCVGFTNTSLTTSKKLKNSSIQFRRVGVSELGTALDILGLKNWKLTVNLDNGITSGVILCAESDKDRCLIFLKERFGNLISL